jgi:hypothetical protein
MWKKLQQNAKTAKRSWNGFLSMFLMMTSHAGLYRKDIQLESVLVLVISLVRVKSNG